MNVLFFYCSIPQHIHLFIYCFDELFVYLFIAIICFFARFAFFSLDLIGADTTKHCDSYLRSSISNPYLFNAFSLIRLTRLTWGRPNKKKEKKINDISHLFIHVNIQKERTHINTSICIHAQRHTWAHTQAQKKLLGICVRKLKANFILLVWQSMRH